MLPLTLPPLKVGIDGFSLCGLICVLAVGSTTDSDSGSSHTSKSSQTSQQQPGDAKERENTAQIHSSLSSEDLFQSHHLLILLIIHQFLY